jgi:N-acetylglucosamine-6-phosphate deacetylase
VRPFQPEALEALWELSLGTLRILTIAPEILYPAKLRWLARFAARTGIRLNMGHSRATQAQAEQAVAAGFTGVTHAWNAMAFHHREPGILGATLGNPAVTLELIPDHWHVHPTVLRWTRILHPQTAWVSDCTPASETRGAASFGPLRVFHSAGASRLGKGSSAPLAGGGPLLPEQLRQHLNSICKEAPPLSTADFQRLIRTEITQAAHRQPLRFLGYSGRAVPPLPLHWVQAPQTPHRESQITLTIG